MIPGKTATAEAKFTGPNSVAVTVTGINAFTLRLDGHPQFSPSKKVSVTVNGKTFSIRSADCSVFLAFGS